MTRRLCPVLIVALMCAPVARAQEVAAPEVWRTFVASLDAGTILKVRLVSGQRFTATLLQTSADAMVVQPRTRLAVPPQAVAFADVAALEVDRGRGIGLGKSIVVGAAAAGATFLALMAFAFAVWGD